MFDEPVETISTERLVLRPLRPSDAGPMSLYAGDVRVARMTTRLPHPYPPGAAEAFIESVRSGRLNEKVWAIDATPSDGAEFLGVIGLTKKEIPEFGYWVGPPFWNTGYASEAVAGVVRHTFTHSDTARIAASVFEDNDASARVLERNGFGVNGTHEVHSVARDGLVRARRFVLDREAASL